MSQPDHQLRPRLRPVEAFPVRMNGQEYICVRDPENLAEQPIFLNRTLSFLVSRMNGERSLRDIQADFFRATGEILPIESLEGLAAQLDEHHYLEGPSFTEFFQGIVKAYRDGPSRPARHAGSAYPATADALVTELEGYVAHPEGPGSVPRPDCSVSLRGLISPHIDFSRGGPTYAHAYSALAAGRPAELYIIFGTCHTAMPLRFSVSDKDYDTPLGPAETDRDFVRELLSRIGNRYLDEFSHRGEHSIEFQTVFLKYFLRNGPRFRIVPILVSSFHDIYSQGKRAADEPEIQALAAAVRELTAKMPGRVCIIAGADLAHVGQRFGDSFGPTEASLRRVESEDLEFLRIVEKGDAEGVFESIAADNDSRRVCGYPPIYMTLRCLDRPMGKLLQYRQWSDLQAGAAVTYAAVAIH